MGLGWCGAEQVLSGMGVLVEWFWWGGVIFMKLGKVVIKYFFRIGGWGSDY